MRRILLVVVAAVTFLARTVHPHAAQIVCPLPDDGQYKFSQYAEKVERIVRIFPSFPVPGKPVCFQVLIQGEVLEGDYNAFKSILRENEPYIDSVVLLSPGGDVYESLKIGALIRQRMLKTVAPSRISSKNFLYFDGNLVCVSEECRCASACFFIWAAGVNRSGDAIMVHRPRDASGTFGQKRAGVASTEYSSLLSNVSDYLVQMNVPVSIIADMNAISSNNTAYIPEERVKMFLEGYVPSIEEWLMSDCGAASKEEDDDYTRLLRKELEKDIQPSEDAYLRLIKEKRRKIALCQFTKLNDERMRLARETPL